MKNIRILSYILLSLILIIITYSIIWYYIATSVKNRTLSSFGGVANEYFDIKWDNIYITGFPFKIIKNIDNLALYDTKNQFSLSFSKVSMNYPLFKKSIDWYLNFEDNLDLNLMGVGFVTKLNGSLNLNYKAQINTDVKNFDSANSNIKSESEISYKNDGYSISDKTSKLVFYEGLSELISILIKQEGQQSKSTIHVDIIGRSPAYKELGKVRLYMDINAKADQTLLRTHIEKIVLVTELGAVELCGDYDLPNGISILPHQNKNSEQFKLTLKTLHHEALIKYLDTIGIVNQEKAIQVLKAISGNYYNNDSIAFYIINGQNEDIIVGNTKLEEIEKIYYDRPSVIPNNSSSEENYGPAIYYDRPSIIPNNSSSEENYGPAIRLPVQTP